MAVLHTKFDVHQTFPYCGCQRTETSVTDKHTHASLTEWVPCDEKKNSSRLSGERSWRHSWQCNKRLQTMGKYSILIALFTCWIWFLTSEWSLIMNTHEEQSAIGIKLPENKILSLFHEMTYLGFGWYLFFTNDLCEIIASMSHLGQQWQNYLMVREQPNTYTKYAEKKHCTGCHEISHMPIWDQ